MTLLLPEEKKYRIIVNGKPVCEVWAINDSHALIRANSSKEVIEATKNLVSFTIRAEELDTDVQPPQWIARLVEMFSSQSG